MRVSKRKRPRREDKQFKAGLSKIAGKVFDDKTVEVLLSLINKRVISSLDYPIAQGKEAMVFRATSRDPQTGETEFRAVKIFKYETSSFYKSMAKYVEGDPRFHPQHTQRAMVRLWARKEYANLKKCFEAGVLVPEPLVQKDNVVVMQFLGEEGIPCALLERIAVENPEEMLEGVLENMRKMYCAGLVHADLSSFNIIPFRGKPFFIDFGQAVLFEHPRAREFLEKDVENVVKFFTKLGCTKTKKEVLDWLYESRGSQARKPL
ncbi:serine protein kinase RIO [Candidatus Micrarchaeota archaeon]|nr:serine protein kinase RIO [Candidatus Micrarchaeota archaeon]